MIAAAAVATAAAAACRLQVFGRYVAYRNDLDLEIEGLAGHRMVEVHFHGLFAHLLDGTDHAVALCIAHRHLRTCEEDVFGQLAVHHECIFRQIDDRFGDHLAVTVLRREREGNLLARLFAQDRLLEFGEQHACSADELEGSARLGLVCDCAVNGQFVIDRYHFVFFYFHCFQKII